MIVSHVLVDCIARGSMLKPMLSSCPYLFRASPKHNQLPWAYFWQEKLTKQRLFLLTGPKKHLKASAKCSYQWMKPRSKSSSFFCCTETSEAMAVNCWWDIPVSPLYTLYVHNANHSEPLNQLKKERKKLRISQALSLSSCMYCKDKQNKTKPNLGHFSTKTSREEWGEKS